MKHEIDMLDDEYTTPQQAAEIRRMKAELPLWQEMENMPPSDAVTNDATASATQALDGLETTIDPDIRESYTKAPSNVSSEFFPLIPQCPDYGKWLAEVALHRALNGTQGQESEQ